MWYKVTYMIPGSAGYVSSMQTDLVYATRYHTQATSHGMVADFYLKLGEKDEQLTETYNQVLKVKQAVPCDTVRLDISVDDAQYFCGVLKLREREGSEAVREIINKAISNTWTVDWGLSKTKTLAD